MNSKAEDNMELFSNFTNSTVNSTRNASEVTTTPGGARVHYARETEVSHMFRLVLYSLIFLLTLVGNSLVIAIVVKSKELKTGMGTLQFCRLIRRSEVMFIMCPTLYTVLHCM